VTALRHATKADLANGIAECQLWSPHTVPLLEAAYRDVISLAFVSRDGPPPLRALTRAGQPAVVVVGDDFADGTDTGPDGWGCAKRLTRWARRAIIHATGGTADDYRGAVLVALQCRRLVLVETGTARVLAWHHLFATAGVSTINLVPPNGGAHPVPRAPGDLH